MHYQLRFDMWQAGDPNIIYSHDITKMGICLTVAENSLNVGTPNNEQSSG